MFIGETKWIIDSSQREMIPTSTTSPNYPRVMGMKGHACAWYSTLIVPKTLDLRHHHHSIVATTKGHGDQRRPIQSSRRPCPPHRTGWHTWVINRKNQVTKPFQDSVYIYICIQCCASGLLKGRSFPVPNHFGFLLELKLQLLHPRNFRFMLLPCSTLFFMCGGEGITNHIQQEDFRPALISPMARSKVPFSFLRCGYCAGSLWLLHLCPA